MRTIPPGKDTAWFWLTLIIAIAGLGPAAWLSYELWADRGAPDSGGDMAALAWFALVIAALPGLVASASLLLRRRLRRTAALLTSLLPLFLLLVIASVNGSVVEDPLLLVLVLPALGYLVLCVTIALSAESSPP